MSTTADESVVDPRVVARTAEEQGSDIPVGWKPTVAEPLPVVRCTTIKKDGTRCKAWSLRGATVCIAHGARLPNVHKNAEARIEAARLRIIENADMAVNVLEELMQPGTAESIRLKASTEILDRAGVRGGYEIQVDGEVTVSPADEIAKRLSKLSEGAKAVENMRSRVMEASGEEDIIDAEVVEDEEQPALFDLNGEEE